MNKTLFAFGLFLVVLATVLLLTNAIPFGIAAALALLGSGLSVISTKSRRISPKSTPEAQVVQTVMSADKKSRAVIKQRPDGKFQVETWRQVDYIQDSGPSWARQGASGITDTMSDAMDMAQSYVHMR